VAELAWAGRVTLTHITSLGRHTNFNVQGSKRDDTKEEHDEE
jgi:hypothetical protein